MRRLNVTEYDNTVRDLFGTTIKLPDDFPPDDVAYGFDNVADALSLTDVHVGYYLQTAKALVAEALSATRRTKMVPCDLAAQQETCVHAALAAFLPKAWRRPPADADVTQLVGLYTTNRAAGATPDDALARVLQAALLSPQFLFRVEYLSGASGKPRPLDGYELAARLSYALWRSMPDDALFQSAASGKLTQTAELQAQVARMLADPKAAALADFGTQWLDVGKLATIQPDPKAFPSFDEALRDGMRQEISLLLGDLVTGQMSLGDLFNGGSSYLNDRLATHYGLPKVGSTKAVRTAVPPQRSGLLTKGAVLATLAHTNETAPVLRGNWILGQLLCKDIPAPPPGIPQEPGPAAGLSRRDRLSAHRVQPTCAACHNLMDPLGLPLEQYDGIGAFRTTDNGVAIDTSGTMPDGTAFAGPLELQSLLAKSPDVSRCLVEHAFIYALGRPPRPNSLDDRVIADVSTSFASGGNKFPALLQSLVLSDAFRQRQD